jgi:hypothetical protein
LSFVVISPPGEDKARVHADNDFLFFTIDELKELQLTGEKAFLSIGEVAGFVVDRQTHPFRKSRI